MDEAFDRALANLERGANFLGAGLRTVDADTSSAAPVPIAGRYRARVLANGLRELDRFLNLLIDEARRLHGLDALPDQRNTASKLRTFRALLGQADVDELRLRALERSRDCLFHNDGRVARGDDRNASILTAGWPEVAGTQAPPPRFAIGAKLEVDGCDIADICAFYHRIAREIVAAAEARAATAPVARPRALGTTAMHAAAPPRPPATAALTR